MRPKSRLKILILASIVVFVGLSVIGMRQVYAVECGPNVTPTVCPSNTFCRPCDPPTLPNLELFAVQLLGVIWGLTGLIFLALFLYNSYLYMFNKIDDAKKRMTQWIIGFIMVLFAQPVVSTVMKVIISDKSTCYDQLRQPSFTFFFPDICTLSTPTPGPTVVPITCTNLKCMVPATYNLTGEACCSLVDTTRYLYVLNDGKQVVCAGDNPITIKIVEGCGNPF